MSKSSGVFGDVISQRPILISSKLRSSVMFGTLNTIITFTCIFNFILEVEFKIKGRIRDMARHPFVCLFIGI